MSCWLAVGMRKSAFHLPIGTYTQLGATLLTCVLRGAPSFITLFVLKLGFHFSGRRLRLVRVPRMAAAVRTIRVTRDRLCVVCSRAAPFDVVEVLFWFPHGCEEP